ncbi:MAG: GerAB/ArcD/ProY family transporter [Clostridiales bacterium]|nr:GerAB/ArcD/ProY family transporter [Clostridiales bacterium]
MSGKNKSAAEVFGDSKTIFSENKKISPRQIRRALTLEIFGISSLILPPRLASQSGIFGIFALAAGAAGAGALIYLWDRLAVSGAADSTAAGDTGVPDRERTSAGKSFLHKMFPVLAGIGLLDLASGILFILTGLIRDQLLNSRYEAAILLMLSIAGAFGLWKGLEPRIRIYEVLFWLLLAPLLIILAIACVSVRPVYWGHTSFSLCGFAESSCESFLVFSLSALLLLFKPHCNMPERAAKSVRASLTMVLLLDAAIYLILLGIFQSGLLSQLEYPVITLMAVVKLPGEFFERQDAFMVGIWFFCLFALFHSLLFYGQELLGHPLKAPACFGGKVDARKEKEKRKKGRTPGQETLPVIVSMFCCTAVFLTAFYFLRHAAFSDEWMRATFFVVGPILLLMAVLYGKCRRRGGK